MRGGGVRCCGCGVVCGVRISLYRRLEALAGSRALRLHAAASGRALLQQRQLLGLLPLLLLLPLLPRIIC